MGDKSPKAMDRKKKQDKQQKDEKGRKVADAWRKAHPEPGASKKKGK